MKVIGVVLLAFLAYSASVNGEKCKAVEAKTSTLRCGDKVYSRPAAYIDTYNQCIKAGGTYLSAVELDCLYKKLGDYNAAGALDLENLKNSLKQTFTDPEHLQALSAGLLQCQGEITSSDPHAVLECISKLYEKVCGHKSCDWVNSD